MGWRDEDLPLVEEIGRAYEQRDYDEMRRLLREHPEILRQDNGKDYWFLLAAQTGRLPLVQILVEEFGFDVNEPTGPEGSPEGVIRYAAAAGHLGVVRCLLDRGAEVNFVLKGQVRCLALAGAARGGHLEVVKMLVERGADIHGSWCGMNPLMQAMFYGQKDIADYLRGVGVTGR